MRLRNDGTTLYYDYSSDGTIWTNAFSELISASGLTTVTGIGIGGITAALITNADLHVISFTYGANATF